MGQKNILALLSMLMATLHWQCVDKYNSPYTSPSTGYLVVEGYISGNGPTRFTLSRTIPLPGDSTIPLETGAKVQVEGNDNTVYPLTQESNGVYGIDTLALDPATQYRLRINTAEGEQYLSSYVAYTPTPPIDSINWVYNSSGVNIYANTHDPTGNIRYFQWTYNETWEYTSAESSTLLYEPATETVISRPVDEQDYTCWLSDSSTDIILGNSAKLAQATIYEQPIMSIPTGTQRLSVMYSIQVRQYALTQDAYNFLSMMQQNTESLGSIFDATPSEVVGNIQCLTNPSEPVIGYVSAGTVQQQRIFISRAQVPIWPYYYMCPIPDREVPADSTWFYYGTGQGGEYTPVSSPTLNGPYDSNEPGCVDCRTQGGSTQEPSWWPN